MSFDRSSLQNASAVLALVLMGSTSVVAQVMLIRELLAAFSGNELSIGLVMANWLVLEAVGSSLVGRVAGRTRNAARAFSALQLIIAVSLPAAVFGMRVIRSLVGIVPGEEVGLWPVLYCSFLILAPISLSDGTQFTVGCRMLSALTGKDTSSVGKAYVYEAIGFIIGGVSFTYLLIPNFHSVQIALFLSALNLASAMLLLGLFARPLRRSRLAAVVAGVLIVTLYLLISHQDDNIHARSVRIQWSGQRLLYYRNSIYGNIAVTQREEQLAFFADGLPLFTAPVPDIVHVEELTHLPLLMHPSPKQVLLVSGGVGGPLNEILKHPVQTVEYAELDPLIIRAAQKFRSALGESQLDNPRVHIQHVDGRLLVKTTKNAFDVVIVNLPTPSTLQINRFYTIEFFRMVREVLNPSGVLVVTCPASLTYMGRELSDLNASIHNTLLQAFPYVKVIPGDVALYLASTSDQYAATTSSALSARAKQRNIDSRLMTTGYLEYKLDERRAEWFMAALRESQNAKVNKDLFPAGLFYHLSLWVARFSPSLRGTFRFVGGLSVWAFVGPVLGCMFVLILARTRAARLSDLPIPVAIATTGFAGMTLDIVLILAFQAFYGYVYHQLALLVTAFMAGLSGGSVVMIRILDRVRRERIALGRIDLLVALYSVSVPMLLTLLNSHLAQPLARASVRFILLGLSAGSGFLVGMQFPLANKTLLSGRRRIVDVAGALYASDLIGSCLAGFAVSVVLVPVLGIVNTCLLVFTMKVASFVFLQEFAKPRASVEASH